MDPQLREAIEQDDTESFENLCNTHRYNREFFLTQTKPENSNILHILCHKKEPECMTLVIGTLPVGALQTLICQRDSEGNTPLHYATTTYIIAKRLVDGYCRALAYDYTGGFPPWTVKINQGELRIPPWGVKNNQGELPWRVKNNQGELRIPPWRVKNNQGELPIQVALRNLCKEVSSYLALLDLDACRSLPMLRYSSGAEFSMENFDQFSEEYSMPRPIISILISKTEESDALLFLKQHQQLFNCLDDSGKMDILCCAIKRNFVDIIKFILSSKSIDISVSGYIPFVVAIQSSHFKIAELIADDFNKSVKRKVQRKREAAAAARSLSSRRTSFEIEEKDRPLPFHPPWTPPTNMQSEITPLHYPASMYINEGELWETPLHYAIYNNKLEFAESILSWDLSFLKNLAHVYNGLPQTTSIVVYVAQKGFDLPPKRVDVEGGGYTIHGSDRQSSSDLRDSLIALHLKTFLKFLRENPDINLATKLVEQHPELIKLKDTSGRAILQYALDEYYSKTMKLILEIHLATGIPHQEQEEEHILTRACRKGNFAAILAIITTCPDSPEAATSHKDLTTVLHVVRFPNPKRYRDLLKIPAIARIMNKTDGQGRSPLMKAIHDDDIYLAQALFDMEGIRIMDIKSKEGETAMNMLKLKSNQSRKWEILYKKVKQSTSYIPVGTDLKEMRSTLSVLAALLATITFAAAFTVPGGFDQNNGDVLLGRRVSFIVFVLSDTYAMCCSMIVLYSLIWSMVWDSDKALVLIDRRVFVLHQSLYATLVAFMTGVYTMVSHKSLWLATVVCVMCSFVPISANRTALVTILGKFVPTSRPKSNDLELEEMLIQH